MSISVFADIGTDMTSAVNSDVNKIVPFFIIILPHFYEMLHAFVIAESTIKKLGSRARVEVDSSSRAFRNDIFTKKEAKSRSINGEEVTTWKETFTKVYYGDNIQRKAGRFYDDYVLSEFLNEHGKEYTISEVNIKLASVFDRNVSSLFVSILFITSVIFFNITHLHRFL